MVLFILERISDIYTFEYINLSLDYRIFFSAFYRVILDHITRQCSLTEIIIENNFSFRPILSEKGYMQIHNGP